MNTSKKTNNMTMYLALMLSLTLGLAPFFPEPHLVGKLKWVFGGAKGMVARDYFDLALHGLPWIYLTIILIKRFIK